MNGEVDLKALESTWIQAGLSRRGFLRLLMAGASGAVFTSILAACGGSSDDSDEPTAAPTSDATESESSEPTVIATSSDTDQSAASTVTDSEGANSTASPDSASAGYPSGGEYTTLETVGQTGGRIVEITTQEPKFFNPIGTSDQSSSAAWGLLFNGLVGTDPDTGLPYPDLAIEVPTQDNGGISEDGLTYTFMVRDDVVWHDGEPFTAHDVVFTYDLVSKEELGSGRTELTNQRIKAVTAPDDYTVVFELHSVVAPFLEVNMYMIVPKHILADVPVDQVMSHPFTTGDPAATIGTGPFKFGSFESDANLTLTKHSEYFRGEPALDEYVLKIVRDSNVLVAQLKTGEADWGAIANPFFEDLSDEPDLRIAAYDRIAFDAIFFQLNPEISTLFQDPRVRHALAYGLNREAMIEAVHLGRATVAHGIITPPSWAYAPDQTESKYTYNLETAQQLLDEAGWQAGSDGIREKDGQRFSFTLWREGGRQDHELFAAIIQQQWSALGVEVSLQAEDRSAYLQRILQTHDLEASLTNAAFSGDPAYQRQVWTTGAAVNPGAYSNPKVDELFADGLVELDRDRRQQIYIEISNIIMEDMPAIILDFPQSLMALNQRTHNVMPNARNIRWNAHTWWVGEGS